MKADGICTKKYHFLSSKLILLGMVKFEPSNFDQKSNFLEKALYLSMKLRSDWSDCFLRMCCDIKHYVSVKKIQNFYRKIAENGSFMGLLGGS